MSQLEPWTAAWASDLGIAPTLPPPWFQLEALTVRIRQYGKLSGGSEAGQLLCMGVVLMVLLLLSFRKSVRLRRYVALTSTHRSTDV